MRVTQRECHNVTERDAGAECQCAVSCEVRHVASHSSRYVTTDNQLRRDTGCLGWVPGNARVVSRVRSAHARDGERAREVVLHHLNP